MLATTAEGAQGFGGRSEVLRGDFNADGLTDLYLHQAPVVIFVSLDGIKTPIVATAQVGAFVLQQRQDRTFRVVSGFTQAQVSQLRRWTDTAIEVLLTDVNADGREDLMLGGIGQDGINVEMPFKCSRQIVKGILDRRGVLHVGCDVQA